MTSPRRLWDGRALPDDAVLAHLRGVLIDSGYTANRLRELLPCDPVGLLSFDPLVHRRRLAPGEPLSALVTTFLFGAAADRRGLQSSLGSACLDELVKCGLAECEGEQVRACVELHPWEHLLVFCDPSGGSRHEDQVLGLTPASATLAYLTVRREGTSALDLGSGCGTEALLAAAHSATVAATDINPRAAAFTALNARFNGLRNVEPHVGSWFEPVAGKGFDLIVSNPPYVISPDTRFVYRDSGLAGDAVCERVVGDVAAHLAEGGFGTVLCNWICRAGADPGEAPQRWAAGTGCDAVVLQYGADDPLAYAASFNQHLRDQSSSEFEAAVDRWLAYYRELGAVAIGSGAVILRRRSGGPNWVKLLEARGIVTGWAGDHVERLFHAHDQLAVDGGDQWLLQAALRPVGDHRIDHTLSYEEGEYRHQPAVMRIEPGAGLASDVDPRLMPILLRCDGRRSLLELIRDAAGQAGHEAALTGLCLQNFARLVELGFLEAVDPAGG